MTDGRPLLGPEDEVWLVPGRKWHRTRSCARAPVTRRVVSAAEAVATRPRCNTCVTTADVANVRANTETTQTDTEAAGDD